VPVPASIDDLSQTPASNYPLGSEALTTADDYFRTYAGFIAALRDRTSVSVHEFGAVGDGVTDDTAAISDALDAWIAADTPFALVFDGSKTYSVTGAKTLTPAIDITAKKSIYGNGAKIINTSASHFLKVTVEGAGKSWRGGLIQDLHISGGVDPLIFEGGLPASTEWLYEWEFRGVKCESFTGTGFQGLQGFFESSFYSCAMWAHSANVTGYGFYFSNGSHGFISSIDMWGCNTRYGLNGLHTATPVSDVNVYGGTYLLASQEGIRFVTSNGNKIIGAHVEDNCQSGASSSGVAGVRPGVRVSGYGTFSGITGLSRDAATQTYTLEAFASDQIVVTGGISGGVGSTKFGYFTTNGTTGAVLALGVSYNTPNGQHRVYGMNGHGVNVQNLSLHENFISYAASITPDLDHGTFINVGALTGNITVNNPTVSSATLVNGSQLEVLLRQDGTGAWTVTWGSDFKVATAISATANARTLWSFRWDGTNWREINGTSTTA
jgi:hypothetical protein